MASTVRQSVQRATGRVMRDKDVDIRGHFRKILLQKRNTIIGRLLGVYEYHSIEIGVAKQHPMKTAFKVISNVERNLHTYLLTYLLTYLPRTVSACLAKLLTHT
jgi:hypothetical protein